MIPVLPQAATAAFPGSDATMIYAYTESMLAIVALQKDLDFLSINKYNIPVRRGIQGPPECFAFFSIVTERIGGMPMKRYP